MYGVTVGTSEKPEKPEGHGRWLRHLNALPSRGFGCRVIAAENTVDGARAEELVRPESKRTLGKDLPRGNKVLGGIRFREPRKKMASSAWEKRC